MKNRMLLYNFKMVPFFLLKLEAERIFPPIFTVEDLVQLLEVKCTEVWGPPL